MSPTAAMAAARSRDFITVSIVKLSSRQARRQALFGFFLLGRIARKGAPDSVDEQNHRGEAVDDTTSDTSERKRPSGRCDDWICEHDLGNRDSRPCQQSEESAFFCAHVRPDNRSGVD